jgi:hypothetical protein
MIIATRTLTLRGSGGERSIEVRIFSPEREAIDWRCRFEVDWPEGTLEQWAVGIDAVQALELTLRMIGALVYASDHHASGALMWLEPGKGYGFPVSNNIRDLLIGDDKTYL